MYTQYRHTLTKIDARASKNLPPPQLSHSLWHVLRSRLALWHIIGTLLLWRIGILLLGHIGSLAHWDSCTLALFYSGTIQLKNQEVNT